MRTFNITVGAAAKLAFTTQPGGGTGRYGVGDAAGGDGAGCRRQHGDDGHVLGDLAIARTRAAGRWRDGRWPRSPAGDFAGCPSTYGTANPDRDGRPLTGDARPFNITLGAAAKLAFTTSPSNSTGGVAFGTQPVVTVQDADGNAVTTDTSTVTLAIVTNPGGGTLSGTVIVAAVNGVATFDGLSIDKTGVGYTLCGRRLVDGCDE